MGTIKEKMIKKGQRLLRLVESFGKKTEPFCEKCRKYNSDYCYQKCNLGKVIDGLS